MHVAFVRPNTKTFELLKRFTGIRVLYCELAIVQGFEG